MHNWRRFKGNTDNSKFRRTLTHTETHPRTHQHRHTHTRAQRCVFAHAHAVHTQTRKEPIVCWPISVKAVFFFSAGELRARQKDHWVDDRGRFSRLRTKRRFFGVPMQRKLWVARSCSKRWRTTGQIRENRAGEWLLYLLLLLLLLLWLS